VKADAAGNEAFTTSGALMVRTRRPRNVRSQPI
jgi:hypothetical protein